MISLLPFLIFGLFVAVPLLGEDQSEIDDEGPGPEGTSLAGTPGDDILTGTEAADLLDGGPGDDLLDFAGGDDVSITEGFTPDETGNDTLLGGAGNDDLFDELGSNLLDGGDGDDLLDSVDGEGDRGTPDTLVGGTGDDILQGDDGDEMTGGEGADEFYVFWEAGSAPVRLTDFSGFEGDAVEIEYVAEEDLPLSLLPADDGSGTEIRVGDVTVAFVQGETDIADGAIVLTRV